MVIAAKRCEVVSDELRLPTEQLFCDSDDFAESNNSGIEHYARDDGSSIYVRSISSMLLDDDGNHVGETLILHDISQEKVSHDQLLLWGMVFKHSGEAILITDADNHIVTVNESFTTSPAIALKRWWGSLSAPLLRAPR
ncbi:hypothetical protein [Candidatus Reidiella endopervernicosa]|uniref:PAS domain-containing protein n=1 Tax=Candidatus Reidiella endopervernicosa TaxID=2738883 RepID=A0A6N0HRU7_9GAMM|nr:hypothetical protein [Candidatus Reidiella endopervernicosa]QKQ25132.1 hypothetical protein HUE57_01645 [Candidatus Reidiella endopervernicosa]